MPASTLPPEAAARLAALIGVARLLGIAASIAVAGAALTATLLLLRVGLPRMVGRLEAAALARSGWRRFAIGAVNAPPLLILAVALGSRDPTRPLGILVFLLLVALMTLGLIVEAALLGRRLLSLSGREPAEPAATVAGGALLTGACLLPVVGWTAFAAILVRATGTAVSGLLGRAAANRP
jgi:hypothetical protein